MRIFTGKCAKMAGISKQTLHNYIRSGVIRKQDYHKDAYSGWIWFTTAQALKIKSKVEGK